MYCVHSSEWGLFGRNTRSAIQGTSSSPQREEGADMIFSPQINRAERQ